MKNSKEIRKEFINFFENKNHKVVKSAPVIPIDDPTLLFTNAGMNQFKDIFLGKKKAEYLRAVDSQKCIRAGGKHNDLEEVGRDGYHHTFFEMLGNWSFADYYKKEAISWAWELLTEVWKLPKDKLYATVHDSDKESFELWKTITDIDHTHIEYHGDKDNFWEMGNTGPCGPSSEIHYDRGEEYCNLSEDKNHDCKVNGDCHRYIELWNLVFMQFYREENRSLTPLENRYVDTGAGFERICQILQGKGSNYDTDLFVPIIEKIAEISNTEYHQDERGVSHRVIADHIRALSFALSDGGMPSNEGRGYVLRRILRRAARHGRLLNLKKPFMHTLVDTVVSEMGDHFVELKEKQAHIKLIIKAEEERFNTTLDKGIVRFNEIISKLIGTEIDGKDAFMLYDTFGFPLDLTSVMAEEKGLTIDIIGFNTEMEKQKQRAREAGKFVLSNENIDWIIFDEPKTTEFVGYTFNSSDSKIKKYCIEKNNLDDEDRVRIVLDKTPFYAESGGQMADMGKIFNDDCEIYIDNVQKDANLFIHFGTLKRGEINENIFTAEINTTRRKNIGRNHTVTHLLHKALQQILGEHVQQKGSLVNSDYLRFDFTHFQQVTANELKLAEKIVNKQIRACLPVKTEIMTIEKARKDGATALFGEKYGDEVRVVTMGDFSKELCGGTHLNYTGEIGLCKITSESSIAAGIRRIEAVTGEKAEEFIDLMEDEIDEFIKILNTPRKSAKEKLNKLIDENRKLQKDLEKFKAKSVSSQLNEIMAKPLEINGVKVVIATIKTSDPKSLRPMADQMRDKIGSGIGVILADINDKVSLVTIVSKDLTKQYHAGKIVSEIAKLVGGKGGGRPDMAMAGGKDITKIGEAAKAVPEIIKSFLK